MKKSARLKYFVAILSAVFVFSTVDFVAQKRTVKRTKYYKVETGEKLRVRMEETIRSDTARSGDTFLTKVTEPVYSNSGVIIVPAGSSITGRVDRVTRAKKGGKPGTIDVRFVRLRLPNGTVQTISGSLTNLDSKDAKSDNEGTASGGKMKHRKIIFIGGGTAGGVILGGIVGGGKGAIIGGIIGGVGGLIGEKSTKGKEAKVKSGTEFGVYVNKPFYLPRFVATDSYDRDPADRTTRTYVVQPGDTLAKISLKFYGTTRRYMDIYDANRDRLASPSQIEVGQELIIP